jgi:hypothetical protein
MPTSEVACSSQPSCNGLISRADFITFFKAARTWIELWNFFSLITLHMHFISILKIKIMHRAWQSHGRKRIGRFNVTFLSVKNLS